MRIPSPQVWPFPLVFVCVLLVALPPGLCAGIDSSSGDNTSTGTPTSPGQNYDRPLLVIPHYLMNPALTSSSAGLNTTAPRPSWWQDPSSRPSSPQKQTPRKQTPQQQKANKYKPRSIAAGIAGFGLLIGGAALASKYGGQDLAYDSRLPNPAGCNPPAGYVCANAPAQHTGNRGATAGGVVMMLGGLGLTIYGFVPR